MSVGQSVQLRTHAGTWRRWLRAAALDAGPGPDPVVAVTPCPGCGLTVALPDRTDAARCPECEALLSVRVDELDVEAAVRSRLYSR